MKIEPSIRGLLSTFFRQRWVFTLIFLIFAGGGSGYALFAKPLYEAQGRLLITFGHNTAFDLAHKNSITILSQEDRREIMQSDMDILHSHDLLLSAVRAVGAEQLYPGITERAGKINVPEEAALSMLQTDFAVKSAEQSNVITVLLMNHNPEAAAQFVQAVFTHFIERQSRIYNAPQSDFLQAEIKNAQEKLDASEQRLKDFKTKNGISLIDQELSELLRQKTAANTVSLDSIDAAWNKLSELQENEKQLLTTYRTHSPQVTRAHESVALAERLLRKRQADLQNRANGATAKIDKRIAELESKRSEYNDLLRQIEIDEANYKNYQAHGEDARISDLLNQKNITPISVVDEPAAPLMPARPDKITVIMLSVLAGLIFGGGAALMCETFDPRFTSPGQLPQALGVPLLASFAFTQKGAV